MKTKIAFLMSSVLVTMGFNACSNSEDIPEFEKPINKTSHKIMVGLSSASTRTTIEEEVEKSTWYWESDASLILSDNDGNYITTLKRTNEEGADKAHKAWFQSDGMIEDLDTNQPYRLTYIGAGSSFNDNSLSFTADFTTHDGTVGCLGNFDAMYHDVYFKLDGQDYVNIDQDIELTKIFTIVHFTLNDQIKASVTETAIGGENVYQKVTVSIGKAGSDAPKVADSSVKATNSNPMKFNASDFGHNDFYLTMVPGENVAPIFRHKYEGGSVAYGTPGKGTLEAGKIYRAGDGEDIKKGVPVEMIYESLIQIENAITVTPWGEPVTGPTISFNPNPNK